MVKYEHHGKEVFVNEEHKGKHREYCICFSCVCGKDARGNPQEFCEIAKAVFDNCEKYNIVSPVWECPDFR